MIKTKKKYIKIGLGLSFFLPLAMSLSSCSSYQFAFGNFQSYMAPNVIASISKHKPISWQYYSSNFEIPTFLQNKTLSAAVATNDMVIKLAKENLIKQIDYSKYEMIDNNKLISNSDDFLNLLTDPVQKISTSFNNNFNIKNLCAYGIPYFLQNFVFCYRGNEIAELSKPNITFLDIFNTLIKNNLFKNAKIEFVDDPRILYGISEIIHDLNNNTEININPKNGHFGQDRNNTPSIYEFEQIYNELNNLISSMQQNNKIKVTLHSDSNIVLNKLANNEVKGAFLYNGDAIFSALGGDNNVKILPNDFHIVVPKQTIYALDYIVFNNLNSDYDQQQIMNIAYNICLSGNDTQTFNSYNMPINFDPKEYNIVSDNQDITKKSPNNNNDYLYLPMQNFAYINYTPTLKSIFNYANEQYFANHPLLNKIKTLLDIKINNDVANYVEIPLNDLATSNLKLAYFTFINKI